MTEKQLEIIEGALDNPDALTEFEYDFIDGLADRDDDYNISPKQNEILFQISQKL